MSALKGTDTDRSVTENDFRRFSAEGFSYAARYTCFIHSLIRYNDLHLDLLPRCVMNYTDKMTAVVALIMAVIMDDVLRRSI